MSIVGYLVTPEPEGRRAKDGELAPIPCSEYYRDVDHYDPVLRAHCRLSSNQRGAVIRYDASRIRQSNDFGWCPRI